MVAVWNGLCHTFFSLLLKLESTTKLIYRREVVAVEECEPLEYKKRRLLFGVVLLVTNQINHFL